LQNVDSTGENCSTTSTSAAYGGRRRVGLRRTRPRQRLAWHRQLHLCYQPTRPISSFQISVSTVSIYPFVFAVKLNLEHGGDRFTSCYDHDSTQDEIFSNDVAPMLDYIFEGITVTIFAYGVTSSGKTHTMQGTKSDPGVIPRVVRVRPLQPTLSCLPTLH
jgi:hypothetical protein